MGLFPYQQRICDEVVNELKHYTRPFVVNAFQSSGKSWMIADIAKRVGKCLVLCMNKELVEQDHAKMVENGIDATIYSASCGQKVISDITVATIGSIYKVPEYCQHFAVIIIDECDGVPVDKKDSMYMKLFKSTRAKICGWTGTPFRTAHTFTRTRFGDVIQTTSIKPLTHFSFWGKIINGIEYKELLGYGRCTPISYYSEDTDTSMLKVNSTGLDYTEESLEKYGESTRERVCQVVKGAVDVWNCKRILVAVPNIEEAERISSELNNRGVKSEYLHSKMDKKTRTRIIKDFKEGKIQAVIQVLILNVGFDLPSLDCVVFARPTLSLRIWCQFVARGIRVDKENPDKVCKVMDMCGTLSKFGKIEDVTVTDKNVMTTVGCISNKILNSVNVSAMARRYN